ncbi:MAG TPA: OsmC family protein [Candidatus Limnocylindrales bacterium]|nr:OsmC family protein [Candidatus Limnocylindrales bacterium]
MLKRALVTWNGAMRFTGSNDDGRTLVLDDRDGGGGPSPLQGLLMSLAGCSAMDVISILEKKRQRVTSYAVEVEGDQREAYPRIFPRMTVTHVLDGPKLDEVAVRRAIFLSATKYCPVSATISAGPTEIHHRFRITRGATADGEARELEGEVVVTGPYRSVDPVE